MENPTIVVQSPGRINIIGEHTDYNQGFVLPAAIDKKMIVQLKENGQSTKCHIVANNICENFAFDLNGFAKLESGWQNYVMGVVAQLQKLGAKFTGFDAELEGNVPIGSGMSSSASLECSLAYGLNELFDLGFTSWQLIKACQMAEHEFAGIKCGIMDQFASVMGKKNQVILLDCRSLEFEYFPFDLGDYELLLLNTNVSHTLASSEYNTRRQECETGVAIIQQKYPNIESLRDVRTEMLEDCKGEMMEVVARRCHHVISENHRVKEATQALVNKDFRRLGELIYQSHYSLQHNYSVSCKELDYLVDFTKDKDYILGSRMMGGGFGGCTISIIAKNHVQDFIQEVAKSYKKQFNLDLSPYSVSIENGASHLG
jgi:galactokinase